MAQVNKKTVNVGGRLVDLSTPLVMGIVNFTPDSFYSNSRVSSGQAMLDKVGNMIEEGAAIVDVGGYSTRPGAAEVSEQEESDRVLAVIEPVKKYFPDIIISVDTFRSQVAAAAIEAGGHIINDVSGGTLDEQMFDTVAALRVPYILMHMRGTPETMNQLTHYDNLVVDIIRELKSSIDTLRQKGVTDIWVDPGFGFAKNIEQNFSLLKDLREFEQLGYPVLAGLSRKATIYKTLNILPEQALNGTTVLNTLALERGASILRVHDVKEAVEVIKLWTATQRIY
ncbi:dihydropteroate synthase [Dyadobacter luteus]|jgi:dihydropteroate synthase|uniref:dihydropteroate synthase n=1 Tax=Dyadobacter luteus TaxID=2259619 RepID=A0A3D8YEW2_9BACT|nr:dihydropteroate synthase [Dyadobacter luteus]REA63136.1 dihydropteroate synthase [Dyadobacter luteus]